MTRSEKKEEFMLGKLQKEDIEKQNEATLRSREEEVRLECEKRKIKACHQMIDLELEQNQLDHKKKILTE